MDETFAIELDSIPWFEFVGQPITSPLPLAFIQVASWAEAFACWDHAWDELKERARIQLQRHISGCQPNRWNELVRSVKARATVPLETRVLRPFAAGHDVHPLFSELVSWDVLMGAMEHEHRPLRGLPVFYLPLLDVYRLGHFPCGWVGEWPEGDLIVY